MLARTLVILFGIAIPGMVFCLSGFMAPEWKGDAHFGWLSCFHVGKFALTPLVVWASAAFYANEMFRESKRRAPWVVLGIWNGAIVGSACLLVGLVIHSRHFEEMMFLFLPLYIAVWYVMRSYSLMRDFPPSRASKIWTLVASLPFWLASAFWMRQAYRDLPDTPPCFVVTAASRGTPSLVGPFGQTARGGVVRSSNLQLRRFWQFEELWQTQHRQSHRCFRKIYNRIGPVIARRIRRPAVANAVYLALKPFEGLAVLALRIKG